MDMQRKLLLSDESPSMVYGFREQGMIRLYQGTLLWAEEQGLLIHPQARELKKLRIQILYVEFPEEPFWRWLKRFGFAPCKQPWGLSVQLSAPRNLELEALWLAQELGKHPIKPLRMMLKKSEMENAGVYALLDDICYWPTQQLSPMSAIKAIRRWQVRLLQLLPERYPVSPQGHD